MVTNILPSGGLWQDPSDPSAVDAAVARAKEKYPQFAQYPQFESAIRRMYQTVTYGGASGGESFGAKQAAANPDFNPGDLVAALYTRTQGDQNWKPGDDASRVDDARWFDHLKFSEQSGPYLYRLNDHTYRLDPSSGTVTTQQAEGGSTWLDLRPGVLITAGILGGAAAGAALGAGGVGGTTVTGAAEGGGVGGGAFGTTAGAGGAGVVSGLTGAGAFPGYFAGDTTGAMVGGNALASAGGGALGAVGKGGGGMGAGNWLDIALAAFGMGGSIYGANQAANIQKNAAEDALDFQREQWTQAQANAKPWITAGQGSVNALAGLMGPDGQLRKTDFTMADFQADPGYQWRQQQGQNALAAQAAAAGNYGSGNMGTALLNYSQGLASDEYQNAYNRWNTGQNQLYNRLSNLAGLGQVANTALTDTGANAASAMGNAGMAGANALAQGNANTWNQVMGGLGAYLSYRQAQNAMQAGGYLG